MTNKINHNEGKQFLLTAEVVEETKRSGNYKHPLSKFLFITEKNSDWRIKVTNLPNLEVLVDYYYQYDNGYEIFLLAIHY